MMVEFNSTIKNCLHNDLSLACTEMDNVNRNEVEESERLAPLCSFYT